MKIFTVDDPVFKTQPLFIVGCSFAQMAKRLERYKVDVGEDVGQIGQMFTFKRAPWRVVWAKRADTPIVLHEIFHLVTRICEDRGITIKAHLDNGECGDEAAAFLFEFFAGRVLRRIGRG